MDSIPDSWVALTILVFALGVRHGMDPDHLATIDGITRYNAISNPRVARRAGILFSLGHGAVVILISAIVGLSSKEWILPSWLESFGAWISILFLLILAALNFYAVYQARPNEVVGIIGLKSGWFRNIAKTSSPRVIFVIGALFAFSFDTVTHAVLFSLAASTMSGWYFSVCMGFAFLLGMMITDGLNGIWVSYLVNRAEKRAVIASRVMGVSIGTLSLAIGLLGMANYFGVGIDALEQVSKVTIGFGLILAVAISYFLACHVFTPKIASQA